MSKQTKERVLNYVPKDDKVGVPGKAVLGENGAVTHYEAGEIVLKDEFTIEHLDRMVARARNRKISVHQFLADNGLVHVSGTPELFFDEPEVKEESEAEEEKPKKGKKSKKEEGESEEGA